MKTNDIAVFNKMPLKDVVYMCLIGGCLSEMPSALPSSDDYDEEDGSPEICRQIDYLAYGLGTAGNWMHLCGPETDSESKGFIKRVFFHRDGEYVFAQIDYPAFGYDSRDGWLDELSDVMTCVEACQLSSDRLKAYRAELIGQISKIDNALDADELVESYELVAGI